MTKLRLNQLPAAVRRRVEAQIAGAAIPPDDEAAPPSTSSRRARGRTRDTLPTFQCHSCGEVVVGSLPAQSHANDLHHGARLELLPASAP